MLCAQGCVRVCVCYMNEGAGSGDVKGVCFIFFSFNVKHFGRHFYTYERCYINKADLKYRTRLGTGAEFHLPTGQQP